MTIKRFLLVHLMIFLFGVALVSPVQAQQTMDAMDDVSIFEEFSEEEASAKEVSDPLYRYNYAMFRFNDFVYMNILGPVSNGYRYVVPSPARSGVRNFFDNLFFPVRFVNNALQLKFRGAGIELSRFAINSTIGIGGLFDPALHWFDLKPKPEDFGQTLGHYGVGEGPYFVMPLLGPSNFRDALGFVSDMPLDVRNYMSFTENTALQSVDVVSKVSESPGAYAEMKNASVDFYSFMKQANSQLRKKQISE